MMGAKRPTNEKIHIGDIYVYYSRDECGSSCAFYQVVGKRAKTLVELRPIQGEWFVDETCDSAVWEVKARPLPGSYSEDDPPLTLRVAWVGDDGKHDLRESWRDYYRSYYSEVGKDYIGYARGYDGRFIRDRLEEEGKP